MKDNYTSTSEQNYESPKVNHIHNLLKIYLIDYAITVVPIFPLCTPLPSTPIPSSNPRLCPWGMHISPLASSFPILFLMSLCLFCTDHLCVLMPAPVPLFSLLPLPADNPPNDLHMYDSVSVLVVCLVRFFRFTC